MDEKDNKYLILEQYKLYSEAKDKFIERQFVTNRFYLVLNISILIAILVIETIAITLKEPSIIVMCIIGFSSTLLWWMNIDSYQLLIKVKYAKVLEYLETKLPEQPYHKEYLEYAQIKKNNKLIVFGDFQKILSLVLSCIYLFITTVYITKWVEILIDNLN